ncbi:DUF2460 domain-containing protein [Delftia tsuruhatensis]|uniref:DUF2460 domain-containing protein n=1 Tax=Delftia tsuruhatensis TaxID=180282 RepID=UPI002447CF85|nr:DUF2460 domain-containing protein [Delftia tsuruhatensis]MDH2234577.1 DUF2460 domain-containing protein [Delftia tsuruhatensis]
MVQVLSDVVMPRRVIASGVRGKQIRRNLRTENQGGYTQAAVIWRKTMRQYEFGMVPMLLDQWQAIEGLYEVTDAGAYGFLLEDPKDCKCSPTDGVLLMDQLGGPVGRLGKRYTSAGSTRYRDRVITRPKGQPVVTRNGVAVSYGSGAGQIALSGLGVITWVADAVSAVSSSSPGAQTVVTLGAPLAGIGAGGYLYLAGMTGTGAALLNDRAHQVVSVAGAVYTLSVDTTGKTLAGGQGRKYPQPADALAWSGGFYVPVQFQSDELDWDIVRGGDYDGRLMVGPNVILVEVRE